MAVQWTPNLSVGIEEIDDQHKQLFASINKLLEAMGEHKGNEEIGRLIGFLGDYVHDHFSTEQMHMVKHLYPQYSAHRLEHEKFVEDFTSLKQEFEENGPTSFFVIQVQRRVCDWLVSHVGKVDKALGEYVKKALKEKAA